MLSVTTNANIAKAISEAIYQKLFLTEAELEKLAKQHVISRAELYAYLLNAIKQKAVVPLSNFRVSAIAKGSSGRYFFGINAEYLGTATSHGIHAEQAAIANAHYHQERKIEAIIVNTNPCGHCRQFIAELINPYDMQIIIPPNPAISFENLLPNYFGPQDLGLVTGILTHTGNDLSLQNSTDDALTLEALKAINRSYAPYWHSPSGIAIQTHDNKMFGGSYLENAAVNPSLSSLSYVLILLALSDYSYEDISKIIFIEKKSATIQQKATMLELLKSLRYQSEFTYLNVR